MNVYTVKDHVISCTLSDIPAQIDEEIWTLPTTKTDGYTLEKGTFNPKTSSQVSMMTISAVTLLELRNSAESQTFTCKITVGSDNWPWPTVVAALQKITILNPSKNVLNKL